MRIPLALAVPALVWSCTDTNAGRMNPVAVPELHKPVAPTPTRPSGPVVAPKTAVAEKFVEVPGARVTLADSAQWVIELRRQQGDDALRALPVGDTLVDRLRYCSAKIALNRHGDVLAELQRLAGRHPTTPMVWRQLGLAQYYSGQPDQAMQSIRRAYDEAAKTQFVDVPDLPSFYGGRLLEKPATRAEGEKILREQLANGADFKTSALVLELFFRQTERHLEALAVINAALGRKADDLRLRITKAQLLNDLHRPEDALAILLPIVADKAAPPSAIEAAYHAHVLRRDFKSVVPLIDRLLANKRIRGEDRKLLLSDREAFNDVAETGAGNVWKIWMIESILRGHPDLERRIQILGHTIASKNQAFISRALRVCFHSSQELLRVAALRGVLPISANPLDDLKLGFGDASAKVRATAATLASRLKDNRNAVAALVLAAMNMETDAYTFRQMHGAMVELTGTEFELPFGAAGDPEQRKGIVARWRKGK